MGSIIPISSTELFKMEEQFAFNGESKSIGLKRDVENLKNTAKKYLNAPYLWGGKSPFGIDCSGFTQIVFKIHHKKLLRDASQQATQGETVAFRSAAIGGDLAFFDNEDGKIIHVGIMLNNHQIIHAAGKVRIDPIDDQGIFNPELGKYTHKLRIIKRFA
jgi:cell wall-associated NlpC family hydrolase